MSFETLKLEREDSILTIVLSRPGGMYALSEKGIMELGDALASCELDQEIRAVVLTSDSRAFCAGADIGMLDDVVERRAYNQFYRLVDIVAQRITIPIARMPKPVIAAVNGVAAGGGLGIALSCDMRIAADTARFVSAYGNIALSPDAGTSYFLPRLVGIAKALELYALNEVLSADQALSLGLVNRVVPAAELMPATMQLAGRLASIATVAYGRTKLLMNSAFCADLAAHLEAEANGLALCSSTEDHQAGLEAFRAKRAPEFQGR